MSIPTGSAWATAILRLIASGLTLWAGVTIGWGPSDLRGQPSLSFVRENPMPWWLWGMLFIAAALLILPPLRTPAWHVPRLLGWAIGFALYAYFAYSTDHAYLQSNAKFNPAIIAAVNGWAALWIVAAANAARAAAHARDCRRWT